MMISFQTPLVRHALLAALVAAASPFARAEAPNPLDALSGASPAPAEATPAEASVDAVPAWAGSAERGPGVPPVTPPPLPPPSAPPVPLDGGLSLLAVAGAGYAARRLRAVRA